MGLVGADVPALRALVSKLVTRNSMLERTTAEMTGLVHSLPWSGPDREAFLDQWDRVHQPNLRRVIDDLATAARRVADAANRQEAASGGQP